MSIIKKIDSLFAHLARKLLQLCAIGFRPYRTNVKIELEEK